MPYNNSKRTLIPINEREKEAIKEAIKEQTINNYTKNKASAYLAEPNVKKFNKGLIEKVFSKHIGFTDPEDLRQELYDYFQACFDNDIVPTIPSLASWLGVHRDTIYSTIANKGKNSDLLQLAVNTCHTLTENGAIAGAVNTVLYVFLSKNYYSMKDNTTLNLTSNLQDATINNQDTMKIIQEQIAIETKQDQ